MALVITKNIAYLNHLLILLRRAALVHKSSLTPPLFIYVPVPRQNSEWSCICVLWLSILLLSAYFQLQLQLCYLVTSASIHLTKEYYVHITRAAEPQSLKDNKYLHCTQYHRNGQYRSFIATLNVSRSGMAITGGGKLFHRMIVRGKTENL